MARTVAELMAVIGLDDKPLISGLKTSGRKAEQEAGKVGSAAGDELAKEAGKSTEAGGGKIADAFSKIGGAILKAGAAVGVAAGAALTKGLIDSMDQEAASDKLAAQLGATEAMSEEYGRVAGRVWSNGFGESTADVTAMMRELFQNGVIGADIAEDDLQRITEKAMTFADVLDQDVNMMGQAVAAMLTNGLASSADEAFDILTRGVQTGVDKSGDLLETFQEYSPLFARLGLDAATATGLLAQGLATGARDADFVADALKEFQIRATDASEASAEGFKLLGLNAEKMTKQIARGGPDAAAGLQTVLDRLAATEDPLKRNTAAVALFGTKAEDLGDSLFGLDPSTAANALGEVAGAADGLGSAYDNNASKLESFKRKGLQKLTDFMGGTVVPMVEKFAASETVKEWAEKGREAFSRFGDGMSKVGTWVQETLWPTLQNVGAWMSETFGPIVESLANLWEQVLWPALQKVWDIIETYLWPAWLKIADVMVNTVIPAVAGLVAKFYDAATWIGVKIGEIVGWVTSLPGRIRDTISNLWEGLKERTGNVKDWVVEKFDSIVTFITDMPGKISTAASGMWDGIKNAFKSALNWIIDKWNGLEFEFPEMNLGPLGKVGGWTLGPPDIPRFHTGGRVPGGTSSESLAILQGGEAVLTQRHQAALGEVISMFGNRANADLGSVGRSYGSPASVTPISQAPSVRGGTTINNTVNVETNADPWKIASATAFTTSHSGVA